MAEIYYPAIRTKEDLHLAYTLVRQGFVEKFSPDLTVAIKRAIRRYNNKSNKTSARMVQDGGDNYTVLIELPKSIKSHEEAETYFCTNEKRDMVFSLYDCTGRTFTSWYKLFQRNGEWYAYHHLCMDV